jgi:hypothetical protein
MLPTKPDDLPVVGFFYFKNSAMSENFGQIPDKVRYNNELTFFARLIYTDILSLAKKENFCFATNQYFADLYNVSQKTVSISITQVFVTSIMEERLEKYSIVKVP